MNSKYHGRCLLALKLIQISTISHLFPLEFVQKCQCSQLCCALRQNSVIRLFLATIIFLINFIEAFHSWLRENSICAPNISIHDRKSAYLLQYVLAAYDKIPFYM